MNSIYMFCVGGNCLYGFGLHILSPSFFLYWSRVGNQIEGKNGKTRNFQQSETRITCTLTDYRFFIIQARQFIHQRVLC